MSKVGSFLFGVVVGASASLVAASLFAPDTVEGLSDAVKDKTNDLKDKVNEFKDQTEDVSQGTLDNLKKKYDNSTDLIKSQLQSMPKQAVNDDSELTDFDDIVIDNTEAFSDTDAAKNDEVIDELKN